MKTYLNINLIALMLCIIVRSTVSLASPQKQISGDQLTMSPAKIANQNMLNSNYELTSMTGELPAGELEFLDILDGCIEADISGDYSNIQFNKSECDLLRADYLIMIEN